MKSVRECDMKSSVLLAFVSAIFLGLLAVPANAQATRTWVSGVGDDANPCSVTAPCKTFAGAISKTAASGEINCETDGGFGAVTIVKAITISCEGAGVTAGVLVAGTDAIDVNLPSATTRVVLSGLDLEGLAPTSGAGLSGVSMIGLGQLIIRNCVIRDFSLAGVNVKGTSGSPATRVVIKNTLITNSNVGVNVVPASGTNNVEVLDSVIDSNTTGISITGSGDLVLAASVLTGQPTAISVSGGGQVISYGNNVIRNAGTPTSTLPLQ